VSIDSDTQLSVVLPAGSTAINTTELVAAYEIAPGSPAGS
jgi:hypothetical protein